MVTSLKLVRKREITIDFWVSEKWKPDLANPIGDRGVLLRKSTIALILSSHPYSYEEIL